MGIELFIRHEKSYLLRVYAEKRNSLEILNSRFSGQRIFIFIYISMCLYTESEEEEGVNW